MGNIFILFWEYYKGRETKMEIYSNYPKSFPDTFFEFPHILGF